MAKYAPNAILAAGMARPSEANPIAVQYDLLLVVFIFDRDTGEILDAQANMVCKSTSDFIRWLLVGRNIFCDINAIIEDISTKYIGLSRRALVVCIKDAYAKICERAPDLEKKFDCKLTECEEI